jgi:soluble lytic murein transglycosylase
MHIQLNHRAIKYTRLIHAIVIGLVVAGVSFQATETTNLQAVYSASVTQSWQLSDDDINAYRTVFSAQERGDWDSADTALSTLSDQRLLGTILAHRYLDARYTVSSDELSAWLTNYSDQPEVIALRKLAESKGISATARTTTAAKIAPAIEGIGRVATMGNSDLPNSWYRGITLWKSGDIAAALTQFNATSESENLTPWQRSAAAFWQYRALTALKREKEAAKALELAASNPRTFYGMIATAVKGESLALSAAAPYVPTHLRSHPAVTRASALSQIGEYALAEKEMRHLYRHIDSTERTALITLASEMNLPNLQVRLGQARGVSEEEAIFASYPMPSWLDGEKTAFDTALMFAISRQESSFANQVRSESGATGLMQLTPSTANYVWQKTSSSLTASLDASPSRLGLSELHDPKTNMLLGQEYIRYLMGKSGDPANLIHVLASYNAGPGMVNAWNRNAASIKDPLLYVESIPYRETRNYVMQVLSNYWAYQSLMGNDTQTLRQLASGAWPKISAANTSN